MNRSARFCRHLHMSKNITIRLGQERRGDVAVKKTEMIGMDRGFQYVRKQPADHPATRRKQNLPGLNRAVNQLAVQQPTTPTPAPIKACCFAFAIS